MIVGKPSISVEKFLFGSKPHLEKDESQSDSKQKQQANWKTFPKQQANVYSENWSRQRRICKSNCQLSIMLCLFVWNAKGSEWWSFACLWQKSLQSTILEEGRPGPCLDQSILQRSHAFCAFSKCWPKPLHHHSQEAKHSAASSRILLWPLKQTTSPLEHVPYLHLAWLLLKQSICKAKGISFFTTGLGCSKPGRDAKKSGCDTLSNSKVITSEYTKFSNTFKFWIKGATLLGNLFFRSTQKVFGMHLWLASIWWKCSIQWCFLMSFHSKLTQADKDFSAASSNWAGTTPPSQVACSKSISKTKNKNAWASSKQAFAGTHTTLM